MTRGKVVQFERDGWLRKTLNLIKKNPEKEYREIERICSAKRHVAN